MPETKPRVWNADDPQPNEVTKIRDAMGDVWTREWVLVGSNIWTTPDTIPMTWERIAKKYGPLTEVDPSDPATREAPEATTASERRSQLGAMDPSERARWMAVLSGLPDLSDYEQGAEIERRMAAGELRELDGVWFERVELEATGERPNTGPETPCSCGWYAAMWREHHRADAAEAKLRFANDRIKGLETSTAEAWLNHGVALSERKAAEAKLAELQRSYDRSLIARRDFRRKAIAEQAGKVCAQRERDEAREKLVAISDTIGDDDPCHDHANHCDAHSILNQVRSLTASYFAEPVTDREEPEQPDMCPNLPSCKHPAMLHDVSGDPEDPKPMCCADGCRCGQASEEPAGETKPRTLLGWIVPDHIAFTIDGGSYVHITCRWALEDDCSTTTAKGNLAWIEQFLRAHAHGQPVERQEQEADRG